MRFLAGGNHKLQVIGVDRGRCKGNVGQRELAIVICFGHKLAAGFRLQLQARYRLPVAKTLDDLAGDRSLPFSAGAGGRSVRAACSAVAVLVAVAAAVAVGEACR